MVGLTDFQKHSKLPCQDSRRSECISPPLHIARALFVRHTTSYSNSVPAECIAITHITANSNVVRFSILLPFLQRYKHISIQQRTKLSCINMSLEATQIKGGDVSIPVVVDTKYDVEQCNMTLDETTIVDADHSFKNNCSDHHFMFRLYVKPFTRDPSTTITPIRLLNHYNQHLPQFLQRPTLASPLLSQNTEFNHNNIYSTVDESVRNRMSDEWNDIWHRLRTFIRQDTLIQAVKQENFVSFCLLLFFIAYLYIGLFSSTQLMVDISNSGALLIHVIVTILMCGVVFHVYTKLGEANLSITNERKKLELLSVFASIVLLWILFQIFYYFGTGDTDSDDVDWHVYHVMTVTISWLSYIVIIVLGIMYRSHIVVVSMEKGRHNEALQKIHDEIKSINQGIRYFTFHPTIQNDKSNVMMEVYCKNKNVISTSQPQLPSSSAALSKRRGRNIVEVASSNFNPKELPV